MGLGLGCASNTTLLILEASWRAQPAYQRHTELLLHLPLPLWSCTRHNARVLVVPAAQLLGMIVGIRVRHSPCHTTADAAHTRPQHQHMQQYHHHAHGPVDLARRHQLQAAASACLTAGAWLLQPAPVAAAPLVPQLPAAELSDGRGSPVTGAAYDAYADTYDSLDDGWFAERLGIPSLRRRLLAAASGDVLEVGVGTGLNLPLYSHQHVDSLVGVDLSGGMLQQAAARVSALDAADWMTLRQGNVTALPFADACFDTVVDTFSLCVYANPAAALAEMARVVKPTGRVLLLEHSRSDNALLSWYQGATSQAVAAAGKGCVWDQDVTSLSRQAGLKIVHEEAVLGGLIRLLHVQRV